MAKGESKIQRYSGGGGLNPANIKNTRDMISMRGTKEDEVDYTLDVAKSINDEYDEQIARFVVSDIVGKDSSTMAYYDGANIGWNSKYFDADGLNAAYDTDVASGFHPSRGSKSAMEAVASHEFGHAITDAVGRKMGVNNIDDAATAIMNEARKETKHRGVVQMAAKISTYATHSNAETIAEAFADHYCNGNKAKAESKAIIKVVNKYLKK